MSDDKSITDVYTSRKVIAEGENITVDVTGVLFTKDSWLKLLTTLDGEKIVLKYKFREVDVDWNKEFKFLKQLFLENREIVINNIKMEINPSEEHNICTHIASGITLELSQPTDDQWDKFTKVESETEIDRELTSDSDNSVTGNEERSPKQQTAEKGDDEDIVDSNRSEEDITKKGKTGLNEEIATKDAEEIVENEENPEELVDEILRDENENLFADTQENVETKTEEQDQTTYNSIKTIPQNSESINTTPPNSDQDKPEEKDGTEDTDSNSIPHSIDDIHIEVILSQRLLEAEYYATPTPGSLSHGVIEYIESVEDIGENTLRIAVETETGREITFRKTIPTAEEFSNSAIVELIENEASGNPLKLDQGGRVIIMLTEHAQQMTDGEIAAIDETEQWALIPPSTVDMTDEQTEKSSDTFIDKLTNISLL